MEHTKALVQQHKLNSHAPCTSTCAICTYMRFVMFYALHAMHAVYMRKYKRCTVSYECVTSAYFLAGIARHPVVRCYRSPQPSVKPLPCPSPAHSHGNYSNRSAPQWVGAGIPYKAHQGIAITTRPDQDMEEPSALVHHKGRRFRRTSARTRSAVKDGKLLLLYS